MLVDDLITSSIRPDFVGIIKSECSDFIYDAGGLPLYKALPSWYSDFQKVKVRFKRNETLINSTFNKAFQTEVYNIAQRAIFSYSTPPLVELNMELFYVFPINGYKFMYSKEVTNSSSDYKQILDVMLEAFDDIDKATDIVTDLLKYTYSTQQLYEGLTAKAEVILYSVPFYYAVRVQPHLTYSQLIT